MEARPSQRIIEQRLELNQGVSALRPITEECPYPRVPKAPLDLTERCSRRRSEISGSGLLRS